MNRSFSYILTFLLLLISLPSVHAQHAVSLPEFVTPEQAGFSSVRLAEMQERVNAYVDDGKIAGVLTMVARKGKVIHFETYGKRDLEAGLNMEHDTIFRIYSMTKPITSTAIMMLYEEGHLRLKDPVHYYIPSFKETMVYDKDAADSDHRVAAHRPVTIHDLLTHTSGLTYGIFGNSPVDVMYRESGVLRPDRSLEEMVDVVAGLPLMHQPGERWTYGVSTDVLGRVVEVVSGMTLNEFMEERIFAPLGMVDTGFVVPAEKLDRFAVNYQATQEGGLQPQDGGASSAYMQQRAPSGGGGLVSTASDYIRFAQMLLNGGAYNGVRILSPKSVALMRMNHIDFYHEPGKGFGLGFSVITDVAKTQELGSEGTYSWSGLAKTLFFIDPDEELIGMVWTQLFTGGPFLLYEDFTTGMYRSMIESYE